tara:strand:+ start:281 stop:922 length:642 start_codon:yes stop_codon:yes gene_type:complete
MKNIFTFGKYKNKDIQEVFTKDKQYIVWLCKQEWFQKNHFELFETSKKTMNEYKPNINPDKFIIYTDGACPNNGSIHAKASIGIHFSDKNPIKLNDVSEVLHINDPSNNVAELSAIYKSLQMIKENKIEIPIELYTDSMYCRSILIEWYEKWVRNNLLGNKKNLELIKKTYDIYKSINNIDIYHVNGHSKKTDEHSYGNNIADKLARGAFKSF